MNKLFALTKNTFIETLRQPIYAIIIFSALLLLAISPSISLYTMSDDDKFLREIGLSTLFLASLFIAIFSASGAVGEEITNKRITTVLSKPIHRPVFIISKFLGVALAVALAHYICTIALLMAIRHGVLTEARDKADLTVLMSGAIGIGLVFLLSAFFNYAYDWKFTSTSVVLFSIIGTIIIAFLGFTDRNWEFNPSANGINSLDLYACLLLFLAVLIIISLATAFSTRFNIIITLLCCVGIFLLGLITDWAFAEAAQKSLWAKAIYFLIPNLQVFWISDAIHEGSRVPLKYIALSIWYAICYTGAVLLLAIALFQRRQVG